MTTTLRWSGWRDVWAIGALVAARFPGRCARLLATCRAFVVPYLVTDTRTVVVGIRPRRPIGRAISAVVSLLDVGTHPFCRRTLPAALRAQARDWRVVDFAAAGPPTHDALTVAHAILALADLHGAQLSAVARPDLARLIAAYQRRGFRHPNARVGTDLAELVRPPTRARRNPAVLRTGRTSPEFFRRSFHRGIEALGTIVLDLGAGDSPIVDEITARGGRGVVADVDYIHSPPAAVAGCRPWAVAADAEHLPFGSGTFDAVLVVFVLQHVCDASAALREAIRVCRCGGEVFCHPVWSRRRLAPLAGLPGAQIVAGQRFWGRTRPAVVVYADLARHWPAAAVDQLADALRPAAGVRVAGNVAARLVIGMRGGHHLRRIHR